MMNSDCWGRFLREPPQSHDSPSRRDFVWRYGRASDEEALKMVLAYLKINEPERRKEVLTLAETYAEITGAPPITQDNIDRDDGGKK
jgi:hypothetical protein